MEKILTLDCYGTLLDTSPVLDAVGEIAREYGLDAAAARAFFVNYEDRLMYGEEYRPYDVLMGSVLEYCDFELSRRVFYKNRSRILSAHENLRPFSDVPDTLRALKAKGYRLALMSNSVPSLMRHHLKALGSLFDEVILAEDAHAYKPQTSFFRYAEEALHLKEKEHWHIAKGYWWDIVPCSKLGWKKIWVNRDHKAGMEKHLPYAEVHTFDELLRFL